MSADEELRQDWMLFDRPDGYDAASEQETRDLADSRHRKRGEKTRRNRIKRNRQQLERERLAEQQLQPAPTADPALPHYLLDRGAAGSLAAPANESDEDSSESDEEDDPDRKQQRRQERLVNQWSGDAAAQDACWRREQQAGRAVRAREAATWDAAHGDEREAQHASACLAYLANRLLTAQQWTSSKESELGYTWLTACSLPNAGLCPALEL